MSYPSTNPVIEWMLSYFLAKNGLTVAFRYSMKQDKGDPQLTIKKFVDAQLEKGTSPDQFFTQAFTWRETTQGYTFWERHSKNWIEFLLRVSKVLGDRE